MPSCAPQVVDRADRPPADRRRRRRDFRPPPWARRNCGCRLRAAPDGPPTDSEHAECGGVDCNTTPFQSFAVHHWGQWRFRFFGQKILTVSPIALYFGLLIGGTPAHSPDVFEYTPLPVTREIDDIRQNFGIFFRPSGPRYSYQIFTTHDPWGSPYDAIKISTLTPKNFEK